MSTENKFTMEEVEVLLLVKALDEFEMSDYPKYTLNDKIENFKESLFVEEHEAFENGLDKMEEAGLLVWDRGNDAYELTEKGKTLFQRLSLLDRFGDKAVKNMMNFQVYIKDFWDKHGNVIIEELGKVEINFIKIG